MQVSYLCCRPGLQPEGQLLAILASQDLISRLEELVPKLERHNGVILEKSKETASSLCRDVARVLITSPMPAFRV